MIKQVEDQIRKTLDKTFKDYSEVNFGENSQDIITKFIMVFIGNLNKKINLDKACKSTKSKETELIGNIEQAVITSNINGCDKAIENIRQSISQYKGDA